MKISCFLLLGFVATTSYASTIDRLTGYTFEGPDPIKKIPIMTPVEYPNPETGYKEVVVRPEFNFEDSTKNTDKKIEVVLSKLTKVDECNIYRYDSKTELKTLQRPYSSFGYYQVSILDWRKTEMGCSGPETQEKWILVTKLPLLDLPDAVVLHVPQEVKVEYRIWTAGPVQ